MAPALGRAQGKREWMARPCPGLSLISLPARPLRVQVRRSSSDDAHGTFVERTAHMHAEAPLRRGRVLLFLENMPGAASQGSTLRLARGIRWFGRLPRGCCLSLGSAAELRLRASFAHADAVPRLRYRLLSRRSREEESRFPDAGKTKFRYQELRDRPASGRSVALLARRRPLAPDALDERFTHCLCSDMSDAIGTAAQASRCPINPPSALTLLLAMYATSFILDAHDHARQ